MKGRRHLAFTVAIAADVVILDQIAKSVVTANIAPGHTVDVLGPLRFTLSYNDGVAFGLAGGRGPLVILLAVVALMALGAFIATAPPSPQTIAAGGLILGGAAGNLIDRVRIGHVTDFVLLPGWPAFNLADVAITAGVILLGLWFLKGGSQARDDMRIRDPDGVYSVEDPGDRGGTPN